MRFALLGTLAQLKRPFSAMMDLDSKKGTA
jgi:hypothetical protein